MNVDKARVRAIRLKIELLRAIDLYRYIESEDHDGRQELDIAGRYEDQTRELCDKVEGLLREVERDDG